MNKEEYLIEEYESRVRDQDFIRLNELGMGRFKKKGFGVGKDELYSFMDIRKIIQSDWGLWMDDMDDMDDMGSESGVISGGVGRNIYGGMEGRVIVFMNGKYREDLSNLEGMGEGLEVKDIKGHLSEGIFEFLEDEGDIFALMNAAFADNGVYIGVRGEVKVEEPVQILWIQGGKGKKLMRIPRVMVDIEAGGELSVVMRSVGEGEYFLNGVMDCFVGDGGVLRFDRYGNESNGGYYFSKTNVRLGAGSRYEGKDIVFGGGLVRLSYEGYCAGDGGLFDLKGLGGVIDREELHYHVKVKHGSLGSESYQLFKNVIRDRGHGSVDTTVVVLKDAQKTYSEQLVNNLMLSGLGRADSKPNLMIEADDVKCSHGATVGSLDEGSLLYLRSRGLTREEGSGLLIEGYSEEVIGGLCFEGMREEVRQMYLKRVVNRR